MSDTNQKNWFARYKLLLVLLAIVIIGGAAYFLGGNNDKTVVVSSSGSQSEPKTNTREINLEAIMTATKAKFPTVKETKIYTEQNDPNKQLGKAGYYVAGAAFWDTRTDFTVSEDDPNSWGVDAGGGIEAYATNADAEKRADYFKSLQGGGALTDPGAYKQIDKFVVRASSSLSKSQQDEVIAFLSSQVQ